MVIKFKPEIEEKVQNALKELKAIGLLPERSIYVDHIDVTCMGQPKSVLLNARVVFEMIVPDSLIEIN